MLNETHMNSQTDTPCKAIKIMEKDKIQFENRFPPSDGDDGKDGRRKLEGSRVLREHRVFRLKRKH